MCHAREEYYKKMAAFFLENNIPERAVTSQSFQDLLSFVGLPTVTSYRISDSILSLSNSLREEILDDVKSAKRVSLILDEWQNERHESIVLFAVCPPSLCPMYWAQFNMRYRALPKEGIMMLIGQCTQELNEVGVRVAGIMTDNCSTMESLPSSINYISLKGKMNQLVKIGCGSHIFNLACQEWLSSTDVSYVVEIVINGSSITSRYQR